MIERWLNKIRAWLESPPPPGEAPLNGDALWLRFIEELKREKIEMDYRELADLLWMERWVARSRGPVEREDRSRSSPAKPAPLPEKPPEKPPVKPPGRQLPGAAVFASRALSEESRIPAVRVRLQGAPALPGGGEITRALRPLARRAKSSLPRLFDEEATAEASAECGFLAPVFRAAPERWFSVALVVEETPSMVVWQRTARELFDLLQGHNAFREVRQYGLRFLAGQDEPQLVRVGQDAILSHRALRGTTDRLLIILLTDSASPNWAGEAMARVLTDWGKESSVVIAQVLSQRLWPRTPLGWPEAEVKTVSPGSRNRALQLAGDGWAAFGNEGGYEALTPVPVVSLNAGAIGPWARMLMRPGALCRAALFAPPAGEMEVAAAPAEPARPFASAEDRVVHFKALVSPETYRLAVYLSLLPLSLPVMRLVQTTMLAHPRQDQLAELLLGGILHRSTPDNDDAAPEDEVEYEFYGGVRELMEERIYVDEVGELLRVIGDYIGRQQSGKFSFAAKLPHPGGEDSLPPGARPFARFLIPALRRLGVANAFGLYDMHGNVWEWCADCYGSDYYKECHEHGVVTDPRGPDTGSDRVVRGGGWSYGAVFCRSANRYIDAPGDRDGNLGFRLFEGGP